MSAPTYWDPGAYLVEEGTQTRPKYAVLVLNQPIRNVALFLSICSRAQMVVAADGGANRIKDLCLNETRLKLCVGKAYNTCMLFCLRFQMPEAIIGDLDSLRDDARTYFTQRGVLVNEDPDQYSTDFGKCLKYVESNWPSFNEEACQDQTANSKMNIIAFGGLGGRIDHAFAQVHQLYEASLTKGLDEGRLFLMTTEGLTFVLAKGRNVILTPQTARLFTQNVGIIPIARPALISTKGLEWDVDEWETEFGAQISTSNHIQSDMVEVETSERVLFTMEFALKPHP